MLEILADLFVVRTASSADLRLEPRSEPKLVNGEVRLEPRHSPLKPCWMKMVTVRVYQGQQKVLLIKGSFCPRSSESNSLEENEKFSQHLLNVEEPLLLRTDQVLRKLPPERKHLSMLQTAK